MSGAPGTLATRRCSTRKKPLALSASSEAGVGKLDVGARSVAMSSFVSTRRSVGRRNSYVAASSASSGGGGPTFPHVARGARLTGALPRSSRAAWRVAASERRVGFRANAIGKPSSMPLSRSPMPRGGRRAGRVPKLTEPSSPNVGPMHARLRWRGGLPKRCNRIAPEREINRHPPRRPRYGAEGDRAVAQVHGRPALSKERRLGVEPGSIFRCGTRATSGFTGFDRKSRFAADNSALAELGSGETATFCMDPASSAKSPRLSVHAIPFRERTPLAEIRRRVIILWWRLPRVVVAALRLPLPHI